MPKKRIIAIVRSVVIALIFFAIGRLFVIQMGTMGIWIAILLVVVFYAIWWVIYQRDKRQ